MGEAVATMEERLVANMGSLNESRALLASCAQRFGVNEHGGQVATTASLATTTTPIFVLDRVGHKPATNPSSSSLIAKHRVMDVGALHEGVVLAPATPTRCSTFVLTSQAGAPVVHIDQSCNKSFPHFDGTNPGLSRVQCLQYFHSFNISNCLWVIAARMHMDGEAKEWFEAYKLRQVVGDWSEFMDAVEAHFGPRVREELQVEMISFEISVVDATRPVFGGIQIRSVSMAGEANVVHMMSRDKHELISEHPVDNVPDDTCEQQKVREASSWDMAHLAESWVKEDSQENLTDIGSSSLFREHVMDATDMMCDTLLLNEFMNAVEASFAVGDSESHDTVDRQLSCCKASVEGVTQMPETTAAGYEEVLDTSPTSRPTPATQALPWLSQEIKPPAAASDVLRDDPGFQLLEADEVKLLGAGARPLSVDAPLRRGHLYFLVALPRRPASRAGLPRRRYHMASSINFNQFLEKEKLKSNGSNFTDWFRHVRIFLNGGNLQYVLDAPLGDPPAETETDEVKNVYVTRKTRCMMEEGSSISEHMLVMTGHAKKLSDLGIVIPNRLGINRVLQSLPPSYKNFVMNYNMQNMNKEFPELFGMLKAAEIEIKKEHQVLMVNKTTSFKKQGKSKGKFKKDGKKAATPPMKPKNGPKPDAECYYCKEKGHWKRNCSKYLADLKSGLVKKKKEGISDIHVIDVHFTGSRSSTWVFDTGSVAHICNSKQELKNKRQLLKDEVTMRVGNGSKVNVIAVGTLPLHLPSGLVLSLNNCYYVPALSMNIISGSCLMQDGYSFKSENNGCSIFMNNIFYGRAPEKNGLFLLDLDSSDTHIHNIDAKRIKLNDNSTYMWHCRLGHIGVKRMKKLHTDGLLESLDFESLDRCEACLMGKMTKTPFSGMMERATDLLEIIHTDSSAVPENVPVPPTPATEEANDNDHETSNETATEPRRSTRDRATPDWYDPCLNVMIVDNNDEDPATYEEAMMSPDSNKWQEAMKSEMGSMYDNKVWTLVELPDSRKAVENKWIFKRKTDADGNITVYKARLVAKGFRQIQGVDYDETFSPVAKLKSVRILLAIAAFFDYEIWQMDVKTAFLNGDIEEELYMKLGKLKQCTVAKSSTESEYIAQRLHRSGMDEEDELLRNNLEVESLKITRAKSLSMHAGEPEDNSNESVVQI
ncbi:hypothetical protein QYE76_020584 [Lolium multiflorum]|uniref:CCHC-type domain-containing protein n=1 Tax=Lolium multiflorum TaxID=4521 RepID=A0AAD8R663_LOLMU|nr:hypothetical protein QYE76_020584 [Lolium multiflorum]